MAYNDVKTQFLGLLNRRDITPTLVETFISFAIQRIQSEVRVPAMEKTVTYTSIGSMMFEVPSDLLEFISVYTFDTVNQRKLVRCDLETILREGQFVDSPKYFYREGRTLNIAPVPASGTNIYIHYYADALPLAADTDTNWITEIAPTLVVYAALSYAADYFLDERKQLFENEYMKAAERVVIQASQDELVGASVTPRFSF